MRLLRLGPGNELDVTKDLVHNLPPYAILSHTWGGDDDEVTFQDIQNREGKDKTGYRKILFCGSQARRDGFEYFWVDTCCIDKTNNTELSEAINSMFRWYQEAKKCYVFLADVKENDVTRSLCRSAFRRSSWFTRGWTLQELIAPDSVDFFSSEEQRLGDKKSLEQDIHEVTSIPIRAIQGYSLSEFDMKERISWSNGRKTGRSEDKAYSLLGIVGVYMPLIYGEGERSAMKRLKMAIHTDQDNPGQDPELAVSIIRCLADLRISDPQDDKSRIESTKGGLLEDSYRWILEHEDFLQWRNNEERHLLWIKGDPGKGKTMLLCGITDTLTRAPTSHCFVSYFFCQATDSNLNNAIAVLRGLIYMLARQNQSLAKHVHKEWKVAGLRLFEDDNAWYALTRILTSMLEDRQSSEVVFIVDALDECSEGLPQLLNFIVKQSQTGRAKWLVSSRNWFEVEEQLKTTGDKVQLNLELNEESIVNAVEVYIRHRVDEIAQAKRLNEYRKNEMIAYLTANASYTFLWVALVCQQLQDPNIRSRHIMDELRCFPAGLDALYKRMVASINASRDVDLYREILGTVSTTYRPVSLAELSSLLESESLDDLEDMEEAIRFCGSFLTIRNSIVYFIHQSAKDFLVSTTTSPISAQSLRPKHKSLCMTSLKALSSHLHRDIYGLQEPGVSTADITPPSFDPLASLQYSCVFWIDHLVEADLHSNQQHQEDIMNLVFSFLTKDYLHWLEALSLIGSISLGLSSFAKLFQYIQNHVETKHIEGLVYDALRCLRYYATAITQYPLQVYAAILVFSPTESLIKYQFRQEEPKWLALKPQVEKHWSALLQTLEGHTALVSSVAFSPDSKLIASGSDDQTVRIWDAATGEARRTLEGHTDWVGSVAFSPDSKLIASGSDDQTVRIWDAATGEAQRTFEGHAASISSVAFSPDSKLVASASSDQTVRIWDAATGEARHTLEGHIALVRSVAFSPDSKLVASASGDQTVQIWDAATGQTRRTLGGHTASVDSVTFSPDNRLVASASSDQTVRIWDAITGEAKLTLEGHTDWVGSVAFSPNSKLIASGSDDQTVQIWDTATGETQRTFEGHTDWVSSVAFSPDTKLVASASGDQTVRIWDAATGEARRTLEGHTASVDSVTVSPDNRLVASASGDRTVWIWDAVTGEAQRMLEGHTDRVSSVVFSPDSKLIASGSDDQTVRIWDSVTGETRRTFKGHTDWVGSVVFSSDSKLIASGSDDQTVRIWDAATGEARRTLEGHTAWVSSVAFSPDSKLVASASYDQTVRIWDTVTGEAQRMLEGHTHWVASVAFSPDNKLVASASGDQTVRIWDAATGEARQIFDIGTISYLVSFSPGGSQVLTDAGTFAIESSNDSPDVSLHADICSDVSISTNRTSIGYSISQDGCWVALDGMNILWLPTDYRPNDLAISGNTVVIGCSSGRVLIMRFEL